MSARCAAVLAGALLITAAGSSRALPADEIVSRVASSVWLVKAYSADEKLLASASGIVVAAGKLVTSCKVLVRASQVQLRRGNSIYDARLEFPDVERDLCQLDAPGLGAPAPTLGSPRALRMGQRIYIVGYGLGNEVSIGQGIVSSLPGAGTTGERIQTTIPAARGLLGGGLFDDDGRLVGIVTFSPKEAPATAFAVPAQWLDKLPARGAAALAAHMAKAAVPVRSTPLPAPGTSWTYGHRELIYSKRQPDITVRVVRSDDSTVEEHLKIAGQSTDEARRTVNAREARYLQSPLASSADLVELAPYYFAATGTTGHIDIPPPSGYPIGGAGLPGWKVAVKSLGWGEVSVPAGTFRALLVRTTGERSYQIVSQSVTASSFAVDVWYVPEIKRYARLEHRVWWRLLADNRLIGHEVLELLSHTPSP